jgi:hypothetical protein
MYAFSVFAGIKHFLKIVSHQDYFLHKRELDKMSLLHPPLPFQLLFTLPKFQSFDSLGMIVK